MTLQERTDTMVDRYGEVCTKKDAGRILNRDPRSICRMINDGRLDSACAGNMVDVRSIARYISAPKQEETEARKRRIQLKYNSEYAV